MSLVKVTPDLAVNVCVCGAENEVPLNEVTVTPDTVGFPKCPHCDDCMTYIAAQPYEDGWEDLDEDSVKRYVMGQYLHFHAAKNLDSTIHSRTLSREEIVQRASEEGRYEFVSQKVKVLEVAVHPIKRKAWERFKETGKITPKRLQKALATPKNADFKNRLKDQFQ